MRPAPPRLQAAPPRLQKAGLSAEASAQAREPSARLSPCGLRRAIRLSRPHAQKHLRRLMAGVEGLEPPTPGFGDRCSNQLSYTPSSDDGGQLTEDGRNPFLFLVCPPSSVFCRPFTL